MNAMRRAGKAYDVLFYPTARLTPRPGTGLESAIGGAQTQVVLRAEALARLGVRVCIMVPADEGERSLSVPGAEIVLRPESVAHQRYVGKVREFLRIWRALGRVDARVVVADCAGVTVGLVALAARLLNRTFIYSSASLADFDFDFGRSGLGKRRDLALYRLGLRLARGLVVQTAEQAALCRRSLGRAPVVIRSIGEAVPERTGASTAFLWIGRVIPTKRPLAYVELARSLPEARFSMIAVPQQGQEQLAEELERAANSVPNLELLGPRPRREVLTLIEHAIAVVSTSEYEGMPNVFLEAWARGVAVLALSHDPDDVIERYGLGEFAHGSRDALVAGARRLWTERGDRTELASRCRRYIEDTHSEDVVAADWALVLGHPGTRTGERS